MNYLAHIFLSGDDQYLQLGNFIADSVKGKKYNDFEDKIKTGILLHRQIDSFTDTNKIVRQSKKRLDNRYGHYKSVIIDIFYDHYLAKNWKKYSNIPLNTYSQKFYSFLQANFEVLPERVKHLTPYLIKGDWLSSYASLNGIEKVLIGMNKRTEGKSKMNLSIVDLKENYKDFEQDFELFFEKLRNFSALKLEELKKNS